MELDRHLSRRRLLGGVGATVLPALAGCVTTELSVEAPGIADSPVFDSFAVENDVRWGDDTVRVSASLTGRATTDLGVRRLSVVADSGSEVWSGPVTGGVDAVSMFAAVGTPLTVHAFTSTAAFVDEQPMTISGRRYP